MLTRVIVAVIGLPLLFAVIFFAPIWATGIVVGGIAAGAAYELMRATCPGESKRLWIYPAIAAAAIPLGEAFGMEHLTIPGAALALTLITFWDVMRSFRAEEKPMDYTVPALALMAGVALPILISSIVRLGEEGRGAVFMLLPFVAAFSSDTGGYFMGRAFGKKKLAPRLSPHKTVAGCLGGFVFAVGIMLIYGLILRGAGYEVKLPLLALYGFFGSFACQLGDLSFSSIKRETGIKDYGKLIPGHGGMLDRFDSMFFTAPAIELMTLILPAITKS